MRTGLIKNGVHYKELNTLKESLYHVCLMKYSSAARLLRGDVATRVCYSVCVIACVL